MLYSTTLVVAASAFAGFASAQGNQTFNTPIPCCTVPVNSVPSDTRSTWCDANENTCVDLCGGPANIASNGNSCDDSTLQFSCKCTNGSDVSSRLTAYEQSVPALMCQFWFGQCINATNENRVAQSQCEQAQKANCGTQKSSSSETSSSASPSSSATSSRSSGGGASSTAPATSASATPGGAVALARYSGPVLAGGLLAVFGIAL